MLAYISLVNATLYQLMLCCGKRSASGKMFLLLVQQLKHTVHTRPQQMYVNKPQVYVVKAEVKSIRGTAAAH